MPDISLVNLLAVSAIALLAPLVLGFAPRLRVPSVVLEIVVGVILGPGGLGWVHADLPVRVLSVIGLAFLLFLAGLEIDLVELRGRALGLAVGGYGITLLVGLLTGASLAAIGWVRSPFLVAVTLSATSLGLVVPVLKDAGRVEAAVGRLTIAAASVADFGAVLLLSLFFAAAGGPVGTRVVLLGGFCLLVIVAVVALRGGRHSMRLGEVLVRLQDTTAEIRVRAAVALLMGFVVLAGRFGLETILGAFVAGAVVGLIDRDSSSHPHLRTKLEAIGYGFLVPVFFIGSGLGLDLRALLGSPAAVARVPVFLLALLLVRGSAALPYLRTFGRRPTLAAALLQATSLPLIVTATQIGAALGLISPVTGAALVCAGLLSVLIYPAAALVLLREPAVPAVGAAVSPE
jgi:Kef-type K+ transport system membrane component KefB